MSNKTYINISLYKLNTFLLKIVLKICFLKLKRLAKNVPADDAVSLAGLAFSTAANCSFSVCNIFLISWFILCISLVSVGFAGLRDGLPGTRKAIMSASEHPLKFISPSGLRLQCDSSMSKRGAIVRQESGKLVGKYPGDC